VPWYKGSFSCPFPWTFICAGPTDPALEGPGGAGGGGDGGSGTWGASFDAMLPSGMLGSLGAFAAGRG